VSFQSFTMPRARCRNALLTAARFGIPVEGGAVYTTLAPCFGCMKELLQGRCEAFTILETSKVDSEHRDQLDALIARLRSQQGRVIEARRARRGSEPRPFRTRDDRGHGAHDVRSVSPAMERVRSQGCVTGTDNSR
jgi:hypothetical protein